MKHLGTVPPDTRRLHLRSFAWEGLAAMFRNWAFDPEVTNICADSTLRSGAVMQKCGMTFKGTLRQAERTGTPRGSGTSIYQHLRCTGADLA